METRPPLLDGRCPSAFLPFFVLGATVGLFTAWIERTSIGAAGPDFALSAAQRYLVAGRALWFYLAKISVAVAAHLHVSALARGSDFGLAAAFSVRGLVDPGRPLVRPEAFARTAGGGAAFCRVAVSGSRFF